MHCHTNVTFLIRFMYFIMYRNKHYNYYCKDDNRGRVLGLVRFRRAVGVGLVRFRHAVELDRGMKLNMFINSLRYYQHKAFSARERSFFEGILVLKRESV